MNSSIKRLLGDGEYNSFFTRLIGLPVIKGKLKQKLGSRMIILWCFDGLDKVALRKTTVTRI